MYEESISDANNFTVDTFSHTSITQRENANTILTSEKKDKSDALVYAIKDLKISDTKYYESNTSTASDAKAILYAIRRQLFALATGMRQLLTLSMRIPNKNIE